MKDYVVIVKLGEEAISLSDEDAQEALGRARDIIVENYGEDVAEDSEYEIREVTK